MLERVIRAARFDSTLYAEVEEHKRYLPEAAGIVVVTSLLVAFGNLIGPGDFTGFIASAIAGIIGWVVWAAVALYVGRNYFGGTSDMGEMLRVLGFASVPMALGVIPFGGLFIGSIWALALSILAIKEGMDFSTRNALLTAIVGWVVLLVARFVLGWFL